jgi:hypothetical protein
LLPGPRHRNPRQPPQTADIVDACVSYFSNASTISGSSFVTALAVQVSIVESV